MKPEIKVLLSDLLDAFKASVEHETMRGRGKQQSYRTFKRLSKAILAEYEKTLPHSYNLSYCGRLAKQRGIEKMRQKMFSEPL